MVGYIGVGDGRYQMVSRPWVVDCVGLVSVVGLGGALIGIEGRLYRAGPPSLEVVIA